MMTTSNLFEALVEYIWIKNDKKHGDGQIKTKNGATLKFK